MSIPLKLGAVTAIAGPIFLIAGTMLHPLGADPSDPVAAFTEYAANDLWIGSHLSQFLGVAIMFVGLVALNDSLKGERFAYLAMLGVFVGVAALAISAVLQAVDGVALKLMFDDWVSASEGQKQSAFQATLAVRRIEIGLAGFMAFLFGSALALFASAVAFSTIYPTWLGWLGMVGGIGTSAGGLLMMFSGFSPIAMTVAMPFSLILVVWMIVIGVLMWRRA